MSMSTSVPVEVPLYLYWVQNILSVPQSMEAWLTMSTMKEKYSIISRHEREEEERATSIALSRFHS